MSGRLVSLQWSGDIILPFARGGREGYWKIYRNLPIPLLGKEGIFESVPRSTEGLRRLLIMPSIICLVFDRIPLMVVKGAF